MKYYTTGSRQKCKFWHRYFKYSLSINMQGWLEAHFDPHNRSKWIPEDDFRNCWRIAYKLTMTLIEPEEPLQDVTTTVRIRLLS